MKTDYITSGSTLPPYLAYPRFLLGMNVRLTAKEVYAIMLDMTLHSDMVQTDKRGRRYLAFFNKTIAEMIDRTPSTVAVSYTHLLHAGASLCGKQYERAGNFGLYRRKSGSIE